MSQNDQLVSINDAQAICQELCDAHHSVRRAYDHAVGMGSELRNLTEHFDELRYQVENARMEQTPAREVARIVRKSSRLVASLAVLFAKSQVNSASFDALNTTLGQ